MTQYLSPDEKALLKAYRKAREATLKVSKMAKENELRQLIIDKVTKDCQFKGVCRWTKKEPAPDAGKR